MKNLKLNVYWLIAEYFLTRKIVKELKKRVNDKKFTEYFYNDWWKKEVNYVKVKELEFKDKIELLKKIWLI